MSEVRRSSRIRSKSTQEKEVDDGAEERIRGVQTDDDTTVNGIQTDESEEESSSDEEGRAGDDDYEEPTKAKKRRGPQRARSQNSKRAKKSAGGLVRTAVTSKSKNSAEDFEQIIADFEPTELFEILATSEDVSIDELLRSWLETYTTNRDQFLQEFINLLLCSCGAIARVENHDVHSNESSNETIGEVQLMFQKQKVHEFHLLISKNNKKRSKFPAFYSNFVEFMSRLMESANELQLLYSESEEEDSQISTSPLILDLLTWLSSLSVCKLRALRYVSTLTLYLFQDYLTEHVVHLESNYLSKLSKQLAVEEKKKRPNAKAVEKLESAIEEVQSSKIVIQSIIDNIIKICFVHRFKDVDASLRCTSMIHLSNWIKNYPEYFLKVTFLKYFGWLLSDLSSEVRLHILKALPQLFVKNQNKYVDNSAVRQFFERFKERILEISLKDENLEVRISAVHVLVEVVSLGYLEESESLEITNLIFDDNEVKITSHSKNSRLLAAVAKFFSQVVDDRCESFTKNHEILDEAVYGVDATSVVKIGVFTRLLNESLLLHFQRVTNLEPEAKIHILFQASEFLYPYFSTLLADFCQILVYDGEYDHPSMQRESREDDEETMEDDVKLLLPNEINSIVLYITTLHGLCYGGVRLKNQPKFKVAEAILPQLDNLMTQLPIHSSRVLSSMLGIFKLFSFEDWIHTGYEKTLVEIVKRIVRAFTETSLRSTQNDINFKAFSETIQFIKEMELSELDELWLNQITQLKVQLNKFLDEFMNSDVQEGSIDENINTLYTMFINKLVLLGKVYPIEFDSSLIEKYLKLHIAKIPAQFNKIDRDTIELMNFKVLTLIITWQLQKWTEVFERAASSSVIPQVPILIIHSIASIMKTMNSVILELNDSANISVNFPLTYSLANSFIDNVVSIKVIELRLPESATSWHRAFEEIIQPSIDDRAQFVLLQVFLYLESLVANEIDIQLERFAEEDANLNDIKEDVFSGESEKEFLLLALKLKGLMKLDLLREDFISRMALNKEQLGSLFGSIMDDTFFEHEKKQDKPYRILHERSAKNSGDKGEPSQTDEMYSDIDMLENDPIADSEI